MDIKKYIDSGILELYVAGTLSEKENKEVYTNIIEYPELLEEVKKIEESLNVLASAVGDENREYSFKNLLIKMIEDKEESRDIVTLKSKPNWIAYSGWAASILISLFLLYSINSKEDLENKLQFATTQYNQVENTLAETKTELNNKEDILSTIRYKGVLSVPLQGQKIAPQSYAKVYWNKDKSVMYLDVQGLPDPPEGKVYQLWSLKLSPLTPTSLGTLENFATNNDKIFKIENSYNSEAFGITLEPKGGSKTPTLEQLYTLGAIKKA